MAVSKQYAASIATRVGYEVAWCTLSRINLPLGELAAGIIDTCERTALRVHAPLQELAEDLAAACGMMSLPGCFEAVEHSAHKKTLSIGEDVMQCVVLPFLGKEDTAFLAFRCASRGCCGLTTTLPSLMSLMRPISKTIYSVDDLLCAVSVGSAVVLFPFLPGLSLSAVVNGGLWVVGVPVCQILLSQELSLMVSSLFGYQLNRLVSPEQALAIGEFLLSLAFTLPAQVACAMIHWLLQRAASTIVCTSDDVDIACPKLMVQMGRCVHYAKAALPAPFGMVEVASSANSVHADDSTGELSTERPIFFEKLD